MSEAATDPMPAAAEDAATAAGAPVEKSEKLIKREAEKKAKKLAEAEKKAAKLAARQVRGQPGGTITVGVVNQPPVELEPCSGTRVRTVHTHTHPLPLLHRDHRLQNSFLPFPPPTTRRLFHLVSCV